MTRELEVALALAQRAGDEILKIQRGELTFEEKDEDQGPVTIADHRADRLIRAGLADAFPNDALLSEEAPDDRARLSRRRLWIIDPLDGTRQFVQRGPEFAVMIGLAIGGRAQLGVVHLPAEALTYAGVVGETAFTIEADGRRRTVRLEPLPPQPERLVIAVSRSHYGGRTRRAVESLNPSEVVRSGSVGRKAALVASGRADLYLTLGSLSRHWDACAPEAVVRAAGGAFLNARGGELVYNTEQTRNAAGLLACRRGLVSRAVAAVEAALAAPMVEG